MRILRGMALAVAVAACGTPAGSAAGPILPTASTAPTATPGPADIVAAFLRATADPGRSFELTLSGAVSAAGFGAQVDIEAEVEGSNFQMTNTVGGFVQELVSVGGETWTRLNEGTWSRGGTAAVPDPFPGLTVADVTYDGQDGASHRLSVAAAEQVLERVWSGMFTDAQISTASFEVLVGGDGVPTAADIEVRGAMTGPPAGDLEIDLHYAFTHWGGSFGITLPAEVVPTPTPSPFVPPAGTIPDGAITGRLAIVSWWGGPAWALVVINPDGSAGKAWGEPSPERNYEGARPEFSPDGRMLAFSRVACELAKPGEVCPRLIAVIDANGNQRDVTVAANGSQDDNPSWSPDGTRLVFDSSRGVDAAASGRNLYVIGADGNGLTRIETGLTESHRPDWSPDGTRIVFQGANNTFDDRGLYLVGMDGRPAISVTLGIGNTGPVWSPDGKRIGWSRSDWSGRERLVTMDPDGSNLVELVEGSFQAWSPNGDVILFLPAPGSTDDAAIWVVRSDGAGARRLPFTERLRSTGLDWAR